MSWARALIFLICKKEIKKNAQCLRLLLLHPAKWMTRESRGTSFSTRKKKTEETVVHARLLGWHPLTKDLSSAESRPPAFWCFLCPRCPPIYFSVRFCVQKQAMSVHPRHKPKTSALSFNPCHTAARLQLLPYSLPWNWTLCQSMTSRKRFRG